MGSAVTPEQPVVVPMAQTTNEAATFNLNLPPEKHITIDGGRGKGGKAMPQDLGTPCRGGGRSARRGRGWGRRPPPVQPRYHAAVSSKP